jgi:hypothetical protein
MTLNGGTVSDDLIGINALQRLLVAVVGEELSNFGDTSRAPSEDDLNTR